MLVLHAGLYAASAGLLKLSGFVLFLWLARSLSVQDYAAVGLWYALQTGLATVALAGLIEAAVGLLKENRSVERQRALFSAVNAAFALMAGPATVVALVMYVGLVRPGSGDLATLACVLASGLLSAFASLQAQIVRLEERHLASLAFSFMVPLGGFVGGFLGFLLERTGQSFFVGTTVGLAAALLVMRVLGVGFYATVTRLGETRPIFIGVAPFIAIAALGWLSGYGNNYIVQLFFESAEIARLTFALMISSIMALVAAALNQVWSPRFFRLVHEVPQEIAERGNRRFYRWQGLALGLTGGALIAGFPVAMRALGGNLVAYQSMRLELLFLVAGYILLSPWWHCFNYYLVHGEGREAMRITLLTSIVGIGAWMVLMWLLGPIGIYVGFMTQMLLRVLAIVPLARRRWPITIAWDGVAGGLLLVFAGLAVSAL